MMLPLFKAPVKIYANPQCNPTLRKHFNLIKNVQRKFTKRIIGYSELACEQRLAMLRLPSLE